MEMLLSRWLQLKLELLHHLCYGLALALVLDGVAHHAPPAHHLLHAPHAHSLALDHWTPHWAVQLL
eukprot:3326713-Pleurochrysis_carterae.AAC.1